MADTNRGRIAVVAESVFGTTPTNPTFQILRLENSDLAYTKNTTQSNELDSSGMLTDLIETSASSGGTLNVELSPGSYDAEIEAALRGTRSTATAVTAGSAQITASTGTVTDTGSFSNVEVGQFLLFTGWANAGNNGWKQVVTNADANTITIPTAGLVDESSGGAIDGQTILGNENVSRSFSVEETFTDIEIYRLFAGQRVGTMTANFTAEQILTGSFAYQGTEVDIEDPGTGVDPTWLGSGSRTAATTTSVLNATSNVGGIYIDGTLSTSCFKSLDLTLDNALRTVPCIGDKFPGSIGYGRQVVNGNITKLFDSITLYNAMLNDSTISLAFGSYNSEGGIHFYLPKVKLGSDNVGLSAGIDTDVDETFEWSALKYEDTTLSKFYQIRVDIATT